jgi:5-methylcytosine-specific restriction endonuclease McrA
MGAYRKKYFDSNKGLFGRYRCNRCGKWFKKSDIDVDHIIPQSRGGTDDLWNLQALCKHCNRSKQAKMKDTPKDLIKNVVKINVKKLFKIK